MLTELQKKKLTYQFKIFDVDKNGFWKSQILIKLSMVMQKLTT
jgi:hypothetical protein